MILHQGEMKYRVRVLLDTGCSIVLLNEQMVEKLDIKKRTHKQPRAIESYTGEAVPRAG